jgi:uncharacterized protein
METTERTYTAFTGERRLISAPVRDMVLRTKQYLDQGGSDPVLIFEDQTGVQMEFEFQGSPEEVLERLARDPLFAEAQSQDQAPRPGRPRLGVVSREVSLLPRHWAWLERQPGGLSATLRKLVETASKANRGQERARDAREAAGKFMGAMAGNLPHFEEATRALYAKDQERLLSLIAKWPHDIREHVARLVLEASRLDACA